MVPCRSKVLEFENMASLHLNHHHHLQEYLSLLLLFMIKIDILHLLDMFHMIEMVHGSWNIDIRNVILFNVSIVSKTENFGKFCYFVMHLIWDV